MEKKFENVLVLDTRKEYDDALSYVMLLISEATAIGALSDPEADNEYIQEIGRVGHLCADYEDNKIEFKRIVKKKSTRVESLDYA